MIPKCVFLPNVAFESFTYQSQYGGQYVMIICGPFAYSIFSPPSNNGGYYDIAHNGYTNARTCIYVSRVTTYARHVIFRIQSFCILTKKREFVRFDGFDDFVSLLLLAFARCKTRNAEDLRGSPRLQASGPNIKNPNLTHRGCH